MEENLKLLNEARQDALEKSKNAEQGEKFFELIRLMCDLNRLARKEGLLTIAERDIPSEIALSGDIREALDFFVQTASTDDLTKILTDRYLAKNYRGENALLYYMIILSVIKTKLGDNTRELERFLVSCLNDESAEKYLEYKNGKQCAERSAEGSLD